MKILSIETGIRCNGGCRFCYQRDYRAASTAPADPTTDELSEKLALGRREGYDGVGFSGGEPTVRDDFLELVARARALGYSRVALTTNGWRLVEPAYRRALLDAGVDAIGWSLHGATAETHEALTGVPGSFERTVRGLAATLAEATARRRRLDVNLFTVVTRRNRDELAAICARFRPLGVRLFVLQPLIHSRGTLADLGPLALSLPDVVAAVRKAVGPAARLGYRVKPYNLPPCLFPSGADSGLETEHHEVRVFRGHELRHPGESRLPTPSGFVRLTACAACALRDRCPGVHASLVPQEDLRTEIARALATTPVPPEGEMWLGGLELADETTIRAAVSAARVAGARRVVFVSGGGSVLGTHHVTAAVQAGVDAVRFVVQPANPRSRDLRRATRGNVGLVLDGLAALQALPAAVGVRREVGLLLERSEADAIQATLVRLVEAGADRVHLEVAPGDPETPTRLADALRVLMGPFRRHAWARQTDVILDVPSARSALPAWQRRAAAAVCRVDDVRGRFVHSVLTGPSFGWVTDSVPTVAVPAAHEAPEEWPDALRGPLVIPAAATAVES